jgi:hypothetical protein
MLVSVNDLQTYMDISFTNRQQDAAEFVLEGLQSELESFLRRPVEVGTFTEQHVIESNHMGIPNASFFYNYSLDTTSQTLSYIDPPATVYLRNTPVATVTSVTIQSPTMSPVAQVNGRDYVVRSFGVELYRAYANDLVTIVYTGGLDGAEIKHFKILILRAATREMQNMHDDVVGIKDLETRNVAPLETGFTEMELNSVRRYRRRRVS